MSCCPDLITLTDAARTKQYSTYVVLLQIQHHAEYIIGECQQLTLHRILQSMDSGNAVHITVPTSDTSSLEAYRSICSLITELISSGLKFMDFTPFLGYGNRFSFPLFFLLRKSASG